MLASVESSGCKLRLHLKINEEIHGHYLSYYGLNLIKKIKFSCATRKYYNHAHQMDQSDQTAESQEWWYINISMEEVLYI